MGNRQRNVRIAENIPPDPHRVLGGDPAQFPDIAHIAYGLAVGDPGTHISLGAVEEGGDAAALPFQRVCHDAGPVPGSLPVVTGGSAVSAVVNHVGKGFAIGCHERKHCHPGIKAAPWVLAQNDLVLIVQLPAVDAHKARSAGAAHFHRYRIRHGAFHGFQYPGDEDPVAVCIVNIPPAGLPGGVGAGMGMGGGKHTGFPGDSEFLLNAGGDLPCQFGLDQAYRDTQHQRLHIALPEIKGRHGKVIRHGFRKDIGPVAVHLAADFRGDDLPGNA